MITTHPRKNIPLIVSRYTSLIALILLLGSCKTEEGKEVLGFFLAFIIFLIGTIVTGIPAIVLSAVSMTSNNKAVPVLAIVFTVLYAIFFLIQISILTDSKAIESQGTVALFPVITVALIAMCVTFIVMGFKKRKTGHTTGSDSSASMNVLDDIINSDDEELL